MALCGLLGLALTPCMAGAASSPMLAFPSAEGAGRFSVGGRGGRVIAVTTLADSGPGSLRAAVEASGPRIIVFRLSGTIALKSELVIRNGQVTIAGQSAPGDGITLRDHMLHVAADDVVIRYIRSRLGSTSNSQEDAITVSYGHRVILDHVSASWSIDESLSTSADFSKPGQGIWDVTVQWSIIADSLAHSVHVKGDHGYGSLIRGAHGSKISYHHNLWANHLDRMPRPGNYTLPDKDKVGPQMDFRSNIFYNWGKDRSGYNYDVSTAIGYNFVDNSYVAGPDSKGNVAFEERNQLAHAYYRGNSMNGAIPADQHALVRGNIPAGYWLDQPIDVGPVAHDPAGRAYDRVLAHAGASRVRDAVDRRVIDGVRTRTGRIINTEQDDGGWPALKSLPAPRDRDGDGMPDAWERAHGLDPRRDDSGGDRDGDGWTNIEDYLNGLAGAAQ